MRSINGNKTLRSTLLLLILLPQLLYSSEVLISYRYVVKDALLFNETLLVSQSMKPCNKLPYTNPLKISLSEEDANLTLKEIIQKNYELFIDYIHTLALHVKNEEQTALLSHHSVTSLTLRTSCFKVDFNDTVVTITPLK